MMHLQGRVFTRFQQFQSLPTALQHEANALADHLSAHEAQVFGKHHAPNLKSVHSVRTKHLLHTIDEWISRQHAGHVTGSTEPPHGSHFPVAATGGPAPTAIPVASAGGHQPHDHASKKHSPTHGHVPSSHAKTLLDALVLKGFLTPYKADKHVARSTTIEDLTFKDNELLVPLSKHLKGDTQMISVWDLVDGAVFAGSLKRKAGPLEPLTHGKEVYAVVNARCKTLTLFKTDVSRKPIAQLEAAHLKVAFDTTRYDHGVKVWTTTHKELLNAMTQQESDALVHALLAIGASHEKRHFLDEQLSPSQLHDPMTDHHARQKNGSLKDKVGGLFRKDDHRGETHAPGAHHGKRSPEPTYMAAP